MNVLVTGGAGYTGSMTVEVLTNHGHEVTVLDNLTTGHRQAVSLEAAFVLADISDSEMLAVAIHEHDIEAVMDFATLPPTQESMLDPFRYIERNTVATLSLMQTLLRYGVTRFIFSSTASIFDQPETLPVDEEMPVTPESVYSQSQYLVERMLPWLNRMLGLSYVTLRYVNAAGASERLGEDHRPETHLIPLALEVTRGRRTGVSLSGVDHLAPDNSHIRDYLHVLDIAEAHVLALESLETGDAKTYTLGNDRGFSDFEVIEMCRRVTGKSIPVEVELKPPKALSTSVVDSSRIRQELGWRPKHSSLETMIASAWDWYQAHPYGYDDLFLSRER